MFLPLFPNNTLKKKKKILRVTTEFTGWPTSSTTPISIEKLLEAARTATVSSSDISFIPTSEITSSSSTTTTTTTTTIRPTTPGLCDGYCEVAGTIRIVENAIWVPELLDRNTREWQDLAEEIERELMLIFILYLEFLVEEIEIGYRFWCFCDFKEHFWKLKKIK